MKQSHGPQSQNQEGKLNGTGTRAWCRVQSTTSKIAQSILLPTPSTAGDRPAIRRADLSQPPCVARGSLSCQGFLPSRRRSEQPAARNRRDFPSRTYGRTGAPRFQTFTDITCADVSILVGPFGTGSANAYTSIHLDRPGGCCTRLVTAVRVVGLYMPAVPAPISLIVVMFPRRTCARPRCERDPLVGFQNYLKLLLNFQFHFKSI